MEPLLLSCMVIIGIFLGKKIEQSDTPEIKSKVKTIPSSAKSNSILEEASRYIAARYIDTLQIKDIEDHSLKAMMKELDPFSVYLPPNESVKPQYKDFEDAYGFAPVEINKKWYVKSVQPFSSTWQSNLEMGDQILGINDSSRFYPYLQRFDDSVLTIKIKKDRSITEVRIARKDLQNHKTVKNVHLIAPQIGYLKITRFGETTYDEFITVIDSLYTKKGTKHFILDLRDNHGGYMEECSRILNQFFSDKNILMAYTNGRTIRKVEYKTDGRQLYELGKVAVLINEYSASASEVFAGAMQDLDRGKVIGQHSYGKGLVQEQYMLSNGGALRLSVSRFFLPSGRTVDKNGKGIDQTKIFKSRANKVLHAGKFIYPDIEVSKYDLTQLNDPYIEKIDQKILDLKIKTGNAPKDPIKTISSEIFATKRKWTPGEKKQIISKIQEAWSKTLKEQDAWIKNHLLADKEIQVALKSF